MKLLLDTHAWLGFVLGDAHLSQTAREAILDPANVGFVSPASYWEISIKISLKKYTLQTPYPQFMRQAIVGNGFRFLHISPRVS
jgi:PIN domain nuclease of toxin-antitoxin system